VKHRRVGLCSLRITQNNGLIRFYSHILTTRAKHNILDLQNTFVMFMKVSLVFVILVSAVTKCWSVGAIAESLDLTVVRPNTGYVRGYSVNNSTRMYWATLDLAVVRPTGYIRGYSVNNSTTMYLTALNESRSRWATLEFMIDWNTAVVGEQLSSVRESGTHNIRELIADGDDGYLKLDIPRYYSRSYSESSIFYGQPGCFNGIDLEGNYVKDIWLVLEEGSKYEVWESGLMSFTIKPKFLFSGSLGNGPIVVCPDCECESECDECDDGLPEHTIAKTVKILVLLTGWAWFLM
jgi:hypothetical protein